MTRSPIWYSVPRSELSDDADRLMPDHKARPDRIFIFDNVQVGPADSG
jgi:hypothetical protein